MVAKDSRFSNIDDKFATIITIREIFARSRNRLFCHHIKFSLLYYRLQLYQNWCFYHQMYDCLPNCAV